MIQMVQVALETKKPKRRRYIILIALLFLFMVFLLVNFLPVEKRPERAFFAHDRPLVIAHQGGEHLAPSSTMASFSVADELNVDVLEFDIHITKDGHLVTIHDNTVDRTTNGNGLVADLTLAEIQELDAGYYFKDLNGEYSYRDKGVYIPTVEEVFQTFGDKRMVIEIKATNPPESYDEIAQKLWELLEKYKLEEQVNIVSFDQKVVDTFQTYSKGITPVAGGKQEVVKFVLAHKLFARNLYNPSVDALQIPTSESIFDLTDKKIIEGAHRRGMEVHYWTINDKETMRFLIEAGADGIMTDRPDLMIELLEEMGF
ncbi:glycerophosphodiester phosphodiesterase [Bacillus luteolus]|uniref:Glycerophosphodiester phosphodiesterase n=1 Tax=Litchfieldia luteola TaxID=682179 RepID=A0ABR9QQ65_9BACI|nr:glycerophosphodiester phosphodiesterase [Cytobacillus luteolus]MBE4910617.1 glycerophosphodiester phosphodiesterase [Cytobacillus luteolus]MBP1943797.1 glycerophosphoryl diester phosphodiesterase [Cytobacillus luteolus]